MSDKRYTVIFDAKDSISSVLNRLIRKSSEAERMMKKNTQEAELFGRTSSNQANRIEEAYRRVNSRFGETHKHMDGLIHDSRRSSYSLTEMGGTPLSRLTDGLGGVVGLLGNVSAAAVGAGTAIGAMAAKGTFDHILMPAMKRESDTVTIGATLKDKSVLPDIMKDIEAQSRESVFGMSDILSGTKGMLGLTQDRDLLKDVNNLTERIALTDPEQGYGGAAYSMKQVMSGDLSSIIDRFELDRSSFYKEGYQAGLSPEEYYRIVDKVISDKGFDQNFLKESRGTSMAQYENAKSNIQELGVKSGAGMLEVIKPQLENINQLFKDESGMKEFTDSMSDRFKNLTSDVFGLGDGVSITWKDITEWSNETFDGVEKIMKSTGAVFQTTLAILAGDDLSKPKDAFKNFGAALDNVAGFIDKINDGLEVLAGIQKDLEPLDNWYKDFTDSKLATSLGLNTDQNETSNEKYGLIAGPFIEAVDAWKAINWSDLKPDWNPFANFWSNTQKKDGVPLFGDNPFGHVIQSGADATWNGIKSGASAVSGWATSMTDGSHANGLSYVPKDDYKANLHKGERVLTRSENQDYSKLMQSGMQEANSGVVINVTTMNVRSNEDIDAIGESIVMRLKARE